MQAVGDDQAVHFSFRNRPLRADRLIFQVEVVSGLRRNDEVSFKAPLSARRDDRAREHCKR